MEYCTTVVLDKIKNMEPENANKIMGYLLLKHTNQEIIEYAFGNDQQILSLINEAKTFLSSSPKPIVSNPVQTDQSPQFQPPQTISRPFSSPSSFRVPAPYLAPQSSTGLLPSSCNDFSRILQTQAGLTNFDEQLHVINPLAIDFSVNFIFPDAQFGGMLRSPTSSLPEFPDRACHYFYKGYCRQGNNCKFFHGQPSIDSFSQLYGLNQNELINDDYIFSPGSLEQLEVEISELLKARKGFPVSIASLPSMYLDKYGKTLQAEGYLTESQRHGKSGFSLTKLLARLNSIRLIDRPHGQHVVVLEEDAPKYECRNERNDSRAALSSSHQIYLTFPAESSFTDEDVLNYFKQFGPVRDVRIPLQEKRMFGFVSFHYPEAVRTILSKGHPHHICGSRVLVKPYKEKTRIHDRKYIDRAKFPVYYPPQCFDMEPNTTSRVFENSSLLRKQQLEEQEHEDELELERTRLLGLKLTPKFLTTNSFFNYGMDDFKSKSDSFNSVHVVQNNGSTSDDKPQQTAKSFGDKDNVQIELPNSPFASPHIGNYNIYSHIK